MTTPPENEPAPEGQEQNTATRGRAKPGDGRSIGSYLEVSWVNSIAAGYPPRVRAGLNWLADYCRRQCGSDLHVLSSHSAQAKTSASFSTLYPIFRGRHNFTGVEAQDNFIELVAALKSYEAKHFAEDAALFGSDPMYKEFEDAVISRTKAHVRNRFVLVVGDTGCGKTAAVKEFMLRHGDTLRANYIPSPERAAFSAWLPILAEPYGAATGGNAELRKEPLLKNIGAGDILFFDDTHRLFKESAGTNQPCWNFMQRIHDERRAIVVACITRVFFTDVMKLPYFRQFFGRAGGRGNVVEFPEFPEDQQILAVAKAYGLKDAREHLDDLRAAAHTFERLRPLQEALALGRAAADDDKEPFTFKHVADFLGCAQSKKSPGA